MWYTHLILLVFQPNNEQKKKSESRNQAHWQCKLNLHSPISESHTIEKKIKSENKEAEKCKMKSDEPAQINNIPPAIILSQFENSEKCKLNLYSQ